MAEVAEEKAHPGCRRERIAEGWIWGQPKSRLSDQGRKRERVWGEMARAMAVAEASSHKCRRLAKAAVDVVRNREPLAPPTVFNPVIGVIIGWTILYMCIGIPFPSCRRARRIGNYCRP
jgi:hypothetical protein